MGTLEQCLHVYKTMLNKDYYITLENEIKIHVRFEKGNFYHLLGLHKLTDLKTLCVPNAPSIVFKDICKTKICHADIIKSVHYEKIENRINSFYLFPELLTFDKSNKIIVDFDKNLLKKSELVNTKYILYKRLDGVVHFTLGCKNAKIYPETFFYNATSTYLSSQKLLNIEQIEIISFDKK